MLLVQHSLRGRRRKGGEEEVRGEGNGRAEEGTDGGERKEKASSPFSHWRFSPLAFPFLPLSPGLFHLDLKTLAL